MPLSKDIALKSFFEDSIEPHDKRVLTSKLGRALEGAAYIDLLLVAVGILMLGTWYFHWASLGNGLASSGNDLSPGIFEALYFCIVTFTTLGYGDLSPVGFGRVVATLIVMSGLTLTALLIGKSASERQQSTLLLLYTSDAQRRLEWFTAQIKLARNQLEEKVSANHSPSGLHETLQSLGNLVEATFSYTIFNANQARLVEFGNASALKSLYRELECVQVTCASIHKLALDEVVASDCALDLTRRLSRLMNVMVGFHRKRHGSYVEIFIKKVRSSFLLSCLRLLTQMRAWIEHIPAHEGSNTLKVKKRLKTWMFTLKSRVFETETGVHIKICGHMNLVTSDLNQWVQRSETPAMLSKVLKLVPPGPPEGWPKDLNSQIGKKLKITSSLTGLCIKKLRQQGRLSSV
jgi:hypothetical protein